MRNPNDELGTNNPKRKQHTPRSVTCESGKVLANCVRGFVTLLNEQLQACFLADEHAAVQKPWIRVILE